MKSHSHYERGIEEGRRGEERAMGGGVAPCLEREEERKKDRKNERTKERKGGLGISPCKGRTEERGFKKGDLSAMEARKFSTGTCLSLHLKEERKKRRAWLSILGRKEKSIGSSTTEEREEVC
jgi:hypothetical protein